MPIIGGHAIPTYRPTLPSILHLGKDAVRTATLNHVSPDSEKDNVIMPEFGEAMSRNNHIALLK
jgi:hypothetical protein